MMTIFRPDGRAATKFDWRLMSRQRDCQIGRREALELVVWSSSGYTFLIKKAFLSATLSQWLD
jgi:hypothetical protein